MTIRDFEWWYEKCILHYINGGKDGIITPLSGLGMWRKPVEAPLRMN